MNMVERVARAICGDKQIDPYPFTNAFYVPTESMQQKAWTWFVKDAKAAIEAMREPTEEMLKAVKNAQIYLNMTDEGWKEAHRVMIDAALKE